MLEIFSGERPFACIICNKGFTCSKRLKVHSRTHTKERPYPCDTCGKTFAYKHVLKHHEMSHLSERLYKCKMCPAETFKSKKAQEQHLKSHISTATKNWVEFSINANASSSSTISETPSDGDSSCIVLVEPLRKSYRFRKKSCNASNSDSSDQSTTSSPTSSSPSLQEVNEIQMQQSTAAINGPPRPVSVIQFGSRTYF